MNVTQLRTSTSHPLRIDSLAVPNVAGLIGMTFCPGKRGESVFGGTWARDLNADLKVIQEWGAQAVVSLIESHEFEMLHVAGLGEAVAAHGMEWLHGPIPDLSAPQADFEYNWMHGDLGERVRSLLSQGGRVLLHCRGGLGRTGMLAAMLLVEFGVAPKEAMFQVRQAREHTIETRAQEDYVLDYQPLPWRRTPGHYAACLLGGAVGDALGAGVEFNGLDEIRRLYGNEGIKTYIKCYGRVGAITDDTQMTLFTAEGLLRGHTRFLDDGRSSLVLEEVLKAYWRWLQTQGESPEGIHRTGSGGLLDIPELHALRAPGNTCLAALRSGEVGTIEKPLNNSKGSGAVMRAAPVGLFMQSPELLGIIPDDEVDEAAFRLGCDIGALTHGHPSGYLPAGCLALLIARLIDGDDFRAALECVRTMLKDFDGHEETLAAIDYAVALAGDLELAPSPEVIARLGEGWVGEEALAISLYCLLVAGGDFDRAVRLAVNHSGDSDSTGAIAGNILGVMLGRSGIAEHWLRDLELKDVIERMGLELYLGS